MMIIVLAPEDVLRPCPFCGGTQKDGEVTLHVSDLASYSIRCACGAVGAEVCSKISFGLDSAKIAEGRRAKEQAIARWNMRTGHEAVKTAAALAIAMDLASRLRNPDEEIDCAQLVADLTGALDAAGFLKDVRDHMNDLEQQEPPAAPVDDETLLGKQARQALLENIVFFPTVHSLAQLRVRWAPTPLPHTPKETRQDIATALVCDLASSAHPLPLRMSIMRELLQEGLRGPADAEIRALRKHKEKKDG